MGNDPDYIAMNPIGKDIKNLITKYNKLTTILDKDAQRLEGVEDEDKLKTELKRLRVKADKGFKDLDNISTRWAKLKMHKSFEAGYDLADEYIKRQSEIETVDGEKLEIFDIRPSDQSLAKKMIRNIKDDTFREVKMINEDWKNRFDDIIRQGIIEGRSLNLTKEPGKLGGVTTKDQIGSRLYQAIKNEGLKLVDSANRRWQPDKYIKMYARTRSREFQTAGLEAKMDEHGLDIVKVSDHPHPYDDLCEEYKGKIFSRSGNSDKYPYLEHKPPYHPNCIHVITPYIPKYHEEKEKLREIN